MAGLNYDRFVRVLTRSAELAAAADKPPILGIVYKETAEAKINAFLAANTAVDKALTAFAKENREAVAALNAMDAPYGVARATVVALLPETVLPETLKAQPTDTDKLNAIERLLDIIDDHVGKPWADTLLQGDFGQRAPTTVNEVHEAIAASTARSKALNTRAEAYGPAREAYLAFKRVVRNALGPGSKDYRRIHLRASPGAAGNGDIDDNLVEETKAGGTETTPPATPPANTATPPADTATPPGGESK